MIPKVAIASEVVVKPGHGVLCSEAVLVDLQKVAVSTLGQTGQQTLADLIPL